MSHCPATIRRLDKHGEAVLTTCGGWLAFIGITIHRTFGWRRWTQCESPYCGLFVATDETGMVRAVQKTEPGAHLFKTDRGAA